MSGANLLASPALSGANDSVLAHGVGTRADLPLPLSLVYTGGGVAVAASFLALAVLWRRPRLRGDDTGRPLPRGLAAVADSPFVGLVLRSVVLALTVVVVAVAFAGPPEIPQNLAPWAFYITFWVGLVPVSLLFGPVWGRVNPLRTLHRALRPLVGPGRFTRAVPALGYWPAAVSLFAFAFLELAAPHRSDPLVIGWFVVGYAVVHLIAASLCGEGWFTRGDGFEAYSRLIGRLAVVGRRSDGVLVWRNPLDGMAGLPGAPGLAALVCVLVGSTGFDGITRTLRWQSGPGADQTVRASAAGLIGTIVVVYVLYAAACWLADRVNGTTGSPTAFAHSLVPIAVGYVVAHYFSLFLLDGQQTFILASDPFGQGWNLFGTAGRAENYTLISAGLISAVQVIAIVIGHVLAVVLAHDRALRLAADSPGDAVRTPRPVLTQLPLLIVMIAFTLAALAILLGG